MSTILTASQSNLLFRALLANAVFSSVSGAVMLLMAGEIAALTGLTKPAWLAIIGIGLIGFGASLFLHVRRQRIRRVEALAISVMDLAWVIGSVALVVLAPGLLNTLGITVVLVIAAIVLCFFELQALALWKTRAMTAS